MSNDERRVIASWETHQQPNTDPSTVGAKAVGLFALPREWVPPFATLTAAFYSDWMTDRDTARCLRSLSDRDRSSIAALFAWYSDRYESTPVLVRSNSPDETIYERGQQNSYVVRRGWDEAAQIIDILLNNRADQFPILQLAVEPAVMGHLSNERRVTRKRSAWLVEGLPVAKDRLGQARIRAQKPPSEGPLNAGTQEMLLQRLREVAGWFTRNARANYHLEWVWNGQQLWIVQADLAHVTSTDDIASAYLTKRVPRPESRGLRTTRLRHFRDSPRGRWKKLECPYSFIAAGIPAADIFVLTGAEWELSLQDAHEALLHDLSALCVTPVVVRTDLAAGTSDELILLPTSNPTAEVERVLDFMTTTDNEFSRRGVQRSSWAFLLAHFLPARASALVHAQPNNPTARVDAIWGLPDGMQSRSHDTYHHNARSGRTTTRLRHKGHCLVPWQDQWRWARLGPPFDWAQVLEQSEIDLMAKWGRDLALRIGQDIQLMVLAQIGGMAGLPGCLPWHFTNWSVPAYSESALPPLDADAIQAISNYDDIRRIAMSNDKLVGVRVTPDEQHIRGTDFFQQIARLAQDRRILIYYEGSLLSHVFYLLQGQGAVVVPINPELDQPEIVRYRKVVRDEIPAIIRRAGGVARVQTIAATDARVLLARKLVEEALEVFEAAPTALVEELADTMEVLTALARQSDITMEAIDAARRKKNREKGGFSELVYLEEAESRLFSKSDAPSAALPLWDGLADPGEDRKSIVEPHISLSSSGVADIRIRIPSFAPVEHGRILRTLKARSGSFDIDVKYGATTINVTLREQAQAPVYNQLELFLESN